MKLNNILILEWQAWDNFLISFLVEEDCRIRCSFEYDLSSLERFISKDINAFLWQINLSESKGFPLRRLAIENYLESKGMNILNRMHTNITKHRLQDILQTAKLPSTRLLRPSSSDDLVIIKSALNWGGELESRLTEEQQKLYGISEYIGPIQNHSKYLIVPESAIPNEIWSTETLIVERFIHNDDDAFYRAYCAGRSIVLVKAHAPEPIKKIAGDSRDVNYFLTFDGNTIHGAKFDVPKKLTQILSSFIKFTELHYFCIDIMYDLTGYYIVDLNLTPWNGSIAPNSDANQFLIDGLKDKTLHI